MAEIQKLNKTFSREQVLQSAEMNAVTGKIDELVDGVNSSLKEIPQEYVTEENLEQKNYATQSWVEEQGFLTEHQDLSGYQEKLVSGENIATINGQSLLEGVDIVIEGGGGEQTVYDADNVIFKSDLTITADVGVHTVGSSGSKTLATTGKSVKQVMDMLFAEEKNPSVTQPSVNLTSSSMGAKEVGTMVTPNYNASLNPGSYQYGPATEVSATSWNITDTNSNSSANNNGTFPEFQVVDGTNYSISATAQHTEGTIPKTNLGNEYPQGKIASGSKSANRGSITGYRNSFYGTFANKDEMTSATIRTLGKSNRALSNGATFNISIPVGALRVAIAYPATLRPLTSVLDSNGLNAQIVGSFKGTTIDVEGANGYDAISYKVYYLDYAVPNDTANTYKVTI